MLCRLWYVALIPWSVFVGSHIERQTKDVWSLDTETAVFELPVRLLSLWQAL